MAFTASWIYQIVDKYSGPMKKIRKHTERMNKSVNKARKSVSAFGAKMSSAQSGITSFAGMLGGAMMLNTFNNFETSMNKLGAVSLANSEDMGKFRNVAKQLGETTQFSAGQVADGMVFLKMAGLDTNKVMEAIPGTLQLAAAGGMDLAAAADIATNVLAQMNLEVSELTHVNDVLATIQSKANTNIFQAAEAMANTGTSAAAMGISLEETTAHLGAMANAGLKGGIAGTLYRNMIDSISGVSTKGQKVLKKYNIQMGKFVTPKGKVKDLTGLLEELNGKYLGTTEMSDLFGDRGKRAFQALATAGTPKIRELVAALEESEGTAARMADIMMNGLPGALKVLKSVWEAVVIAIFESGFADIVLGIVKGVSKLLQIVTKSNPFLLKMVGIAGLLAVALGPVLMILGFMATAVSALMGIWPVLAAFVTASISPFIAIGAAIAVVAALLIKAFTSSSKLRASFSGLFDALSPLTDLFKDLWNWIGGTEVITGTLVETFSTLADIIANILTSVIVNLTATIDSLMSPLETIKAGYAVLFGGGGGVVAGAAGANKNTLSGKIEVSASGGAQVNSAEMSSDAGGDLGFNMGGG